MSSYDFTLKGKSNLLPRLHCMLDCFAFILEKMKPPIDYRPIYFGAWNTPVFLDKDGYISYYSRDTTLDSFIKDFISLYGNAIETFQEYRKGKEYNYQLFHSKMMNKKSNEWIIITVDLYYLDYPNQCYGLKHRPHNIIISEETTDGWQIIDPYFAWTGNVLKEELIQGFSFNDTKLSISLNQDGLCSLNSVYAIRKLRDASLQSDDELFDVIFKYFTEAQTSENPKTAAVDISNKLNQIGVLAKRKNAYSLAISYLQDYFGVDLGPIEEKMKPLLSGWNSLGYLVVKFGVTADLANMNHLLQKVKTLNHLEREIKTELVTICNKLEGQGIDTKFIEGF